MSETQPEVALPALTEVFSLVPKSMTELMDFSKMISTSGVCPKDFKGKTGDVAVAISMGLEVGLKPLQALQNIAVINGRPTLWGDAMKALVLASPLCEYFKEDDFETITEKKMAVCIAKRRGKPETRTTFSWDDAQRAGLAEKTGPWTQYRPRMMQMRARGFMIRDEFADIVKGLQMREEVEDYAPLKDAPHEVTAPQRLSQTTQAEKPVEEAEEKKPVEKTKGSWTGKVTSIASSDDKKNPRYTIIAADGMGFHTFDKKVGKFLKEAGPELEVLLEFEKTEYGNKVTSAEPANAEEPPKKEDLFDAER